MAEKHPTASPATPKPQDKQEKPPLQPQQEEDKADPTRYGDWERNGRCIDF